MEKGKAMFEIATISSAISSLQTAAQIARGMMGLRDATLVQGKVIELQSAILAAQTDALTAQSEQYSLVEKIRRLEEEVARVKAWEREKDKYELKEVHPRNFARSIKPNAQGSEPAHLICASHVNIKVRTLRTFPTALNQTPPDSTKFAYLKG